MDGRYIEEEKAKLKGSKVRGKKIFLHPKPQGLKGLQKDYLPIATTAKLKPADFAAISARPSCHAVD